MATMIGEIYDAFIEAGATPDKARKAAKSVASYDSKFPPIEQRMTKLEGRIDLLTWMVGFNTAVGLAVLYRLFSG